MGERRKQVEKRNLVRLSIFLSLEFSLNDVGMMKVTDDSQQWPILGFL
jgi:hypothetical protein